MPVLKVRNKELDFSAFSLLGQIMLSDSINF